MGYVIMLTLHLVLTDLVLGAGLKILLGRCVICSAHGQAVRLSWVVTLNKCEVFSKLLDREEWLVKFPATVSVPR